MLRLPCVVFEFEFGSALAAVHVLLTLPQGFFQMELDVSVDDKTIAERESTLRQLDIIANCIAMSVITLHVHSRDGHAIIRLSHSYSQRAKDVFSMLCDFLRKFKHMLLHTWLGFRRRTMTIHAHKTVAHSLPFLRINLVT